MAASTMTRGVAGALMLVCEGGQWHNTCARYFVACSLIGALVYLTVFALICMHDLHARFWLGYLPAYVLGAAALAVGPLLFLLGYSMYLSFNRNRQRKARGASSMGGRFNERQADYLTLKAWKVWTMCQCVLAASVLSWVLAGSMLYTGSTISDALLQRCGEQGISKQLDATHSRLAEFSAGCASGPDSEDMPVHLCPGFEEAFPPPSPFVTYLKVLEENLECAGFCSQVESPLFSMNAAEEAQLEACGARLAGVLWKVSLLAGVPAMVAGGLSFVAAYALINHDEL